MRKDETPGRIFKPSTNIHNTNMRLLRKFWPCSFHQNFGKELDGEDTRMFHLYKLHDLFSMIFSSLNVYVHKTKKINKVNLYFFR